MSLISEKAKSVNNIVYFKHVGFCIMIRISDFRFVFIIYRLITVSLTNVITVGGRRPTEFQQGISITIALSLVL